MRRKARIVPFLLPVAVALTTGCAASSSSPARLPAPRLAASPALPASPSPAGLRAPTTPPAATPAQLTGSVGLEDADQESRRYGPGPSPAAGRAPDDAGSPDAPAVGAVRLPGIYLRLLRASPTCVAIPPPAVPSLPAPAHPVPTLRA